MDTAIRERGVYTFGPFRLDATRRALTRGGAPVALTPTVFDTLLYLVEHPGRVVTKDELLDAIWPRRVVEESNISQTIFTLRKALNGAGEQDRFIVTAPGRGYRFTAAVRFEAGSPPAVPLEFVSTPPDERSGIWRRRAPILAAAALVAIVLVVAGTFIATRIGRGPLPAGSPNVLVVADFRNRTGDPIFDKTLGKVLEIDLDQSPFLTVLPEQRIADTLVLMTRAKDEPLTPALAREVCSRNDGRAVLEGSIAALGAKYLLTLTATDCAGARTLAAEKVEVTGREAVVAALDRLGGGMRQRLGESTGSIARFGVPLARKRTASLAALKAYSEASWLYDHGHRMESIPLFQHAIELDPNFATAYAELSAVYSGLHQNSLDVANITKAYALRDTVNEREKFYIVARYNQSATKDIGETIRNLRVWTQTYPRDGTPWANLANAENWIGRYPAAIEAGRRALALSPGRESAYVILARAYMHAGQLDVASAIAARAVAKGVAGDDTHGLILQIDLARGDGAGAEREMAWARGKPAERTMLIVAARDAYRQGQVRRGEEMFARVAALSKDQGLGDFTLAPRARELIDLGLEDRARVLLSQVPAGVDSQDYRFDTAEAGDPARAMALVARDLARSPSDTLLNDVAAPEVRAALALRRGRADQAVAALRPALPYDGRLYDIPYLRGRAYLAAGDGSRAAAEFQKILLHPGVEPASPLYPLARLGLARALRLQGDIRASRGAYQALLAAWKNADPDLPALVAAKAEYARL